MLLKNRKALVKLMAIEGLSQRRLAAAAGWRSHSYVGRLMAGKARTVTPEAAARIAATLGVAVGDLFASDGGDTEPPAQPT
jgi:transcriptional regulator with XRE-family HTH domain